MTTNEKHAARLREYAKTRRIHAQRAGENGFVTMEKLHTECAESQEAGAEALAATDKTTQGRWRIMVRGLHDTPYLVPEADYQRAIESPDIIESAVRADTVVVAVVELP